MNCFGDKQETKGETDLSGIERESTRYLWWFGFWWFWSIVLIVALSIQLTSKQFDSDSFRPLSIK